MLISQRCRLDAFFHRTFYRVRAIRFHDVHHTHATPASTIDTYQHVLPGMQADAARLFEQLIAPAREDYW